jgi:hypothetical protein
VCQRTSDLAFRAGPLALDSSWIRLRRPVRPLMTTGSQLHTRAVDQLVPRRLLPSPPQCRVRATCVLTSSKFCCCGLGELVRWSDAGGSSQGVSDQWSDRRNNAEYRRWCATGNGLVHRLGEILVACRPCRLIGAGESDLGECCLDGLPMAPSS